MPVGNRSALGGEAQVRWMKMRFLGWDPPAGGSAEAPVQTAGLVDLMGTIVLPKRDRLRVSTMSVSMGGSFGRGTLDDHVAARTASGLYGLTVRASYSSLAVVRSNPGSVPKDHPLWHWFVRTQYHYLWAHQVDAYIPNSAWPGLIGVYVSAGVGAHWGPPRPTGGKKKAGKRKKARRK